MSYCENCALEFDNEKNFCRFCGGNLRKHPVKVELLQPIQPRTQCVAKKTQRPDRLPPAGKRRFSIFLFMVMIILGGYWVFARFYETGTTPSKMKTFSAAPLFGTSKAQTEAGMSGSSMKEVVQVLDNLKKANLTKDIDLFLSCYSPEFPSLMEKKSATLAGWKAYDYKAIHYTIKNHYFYKDNAVGVVAWSITASEPNTGKSVSNEVAYNVVMHRENSRYKIASLEMLP